MYDIYPTLDRVVIKPRKADEFTKGGIALPERSQVAKRIGTVVAVGPGMYRQYPPASIPGVAGTSDFDRMEMQVAVGDTVLFPHTTEALRINPDDVEDVLLICRECELLAVLKDQSEVV